ncbi:hypothetical protein E4V42_10790 [Clostridium estertheticum]|uniref:Uncharacterized protein n=1 Tax=Clostridium estertheticum TaxID=238834 RepID=A0A5N7J1G3_9CLOT|nr:hypothetical protein [Clostridium estertheticum]MPQ31917.1 hypothetical protein [Clostridium estertheticum]MPQ62586.1 hypothetical protein [Clostridium estertheticum]
MEVNMEIVERLEKINWFKNCGKPLSISLMYDVNYAKDINSVIKHISSTRWGNIGLEEKNDLTSYLFKNYPNKYHQVWNELVENIKENIMINIKNEAIKMANNKGLNDNSIIGHIEWDILIIIMAFTYSEYKEPTFYKEILRIYESGNIPCGWKGTYPNGRIIIY